MNSRHVRGRLAPRSAGSFAIAALAAELSAQLADELPRLGIDGLKVSLREAQSPGGPVQLLLREWRAAPLAEVAELVERFARQLGIASYELCIAGQPPLRRGRAPRRRSAERPTRLTTAIPSARSRAFGSGIAPSMA